MNAISKAVKILQGLEELKEDWRTRPDKQHKFLDPDTITPTTIKGGEWSVTYPEKVEITYDAIHLINYSKVPTISIGPNDKTCHSIDEFVDIGELINLTRILALSIMRWCGCA